MHCRWPSGARGEFKTYPAVFTTHEEGRKWPPLLRNEAMEEIRATGQKQLGDLFGLDRALENDLSGSKVARAIRSG